MTLARSPDETEVAIRRLLAEYVRVVDGGMLNQWPALFAAEASYVVVARENAARGLPLALVCDDTRARINDRVTFIQEFWVGSYNGYWPRHLVSDPTIEPDSGGEHRVEQNFAVYITEPGAVGSSLLVVGQYQDRIALDGAVPRFKERRVVLDTTILPRYFVYPL